MRLVGILKYSLCENICLSWHYCYLIVYLLSCVMVLRQCAVGIDHGGFRDVCSCKSGVIRGVDNAQKI